jgi:DNA-binding NarL/FixJ family response regulator
MIIMIEIIDLDHNSLISVGLNAFLSEKTTDIRVTEDASSDSELMEKLSRKQPDLLIFNISMENRNGIEFLKKLRSSYPDLPVLMFSEHPDKRFAIRALRAGASGYLDGKRVLENIETAIRTIVEQKKRYISPEIAQELANYVDGTQNVLPHEKLTDREYEVLCMIASGKKVHDIAEKLSLSTQTIHTYRRRLKDKMNMSTDAELIRYALDEKLID